MRSSIKTIENIISAMHPYSTGFSDVMCDADGNIYVPIKRGGKVLNYQMIRKDGSSTFLLHNRLGGGSYTIGNIEETDTIHIFTSFMVAKDAFEKAHIPSVVAFSESNLKRIRKKMSRTHTVAIEPYTYPTHDDVSTVDVPCHEKEGGKIIPSTLGEKKMSQHETYTATLLEKVKRIVYSGKDLTKQINPASWLIRDFIPKGKKTGVLFGPSGVGKTFVGLDMCLHIAAGMESWHGAICHQAKVLYIAGESEDSVNIRVASFERKYGDAFKDNFYAMFLDVPLSEQLGMDLLTTAIDNSIIPFVPELMVFDTFNCYYTGDENDAGAIGNFKMTRILRLQHMYGANIMFVHHTTKGDATTERGSGAIKGLADYMILVNSENPEDDEDLRLNVKVVKNRNGKEGTTEICRVVPVPLASWEPDEDGIVPEGAVIEHISNSFDDGPLSEAGRRNLNILVKAMLEYGSKTETGEWNMSGSDFRKYLNNALPDDAGKKDKIDKSTCIKGNRFFPVLTEARIVRLTVNDKHIEKISIISEKLKKEMSVSAENVNKPVDHPMEN